MAIQRTKRPHGILSVLEILSHSYSTDATCLERNLNLVLQILEYTAMP
jgi:hypothetical protein